MKISEGMLAKLQKIKARYHEVGDMLARPEIISDQSAFKALSKEHSDLQPIVECFEVYTTHKNHFDECTEMLSVEQDAEMREMLKEELDELREALDRDVNDLKISMLPKDPNEDNNVIIEIRAERAATKQHCSARNL